ncbi:MAG: glycosyltransferase family 2 protein [Bacteroidales bacterium]|nr:glycosyltransferase family 2 protein [Bacteroidales bacterium]
MPLVSVIIPAYNYAHYLPFTIDSVVEQSLSDWECLIIDDGSTDNTKDVAEKYSVADRRIKYFYKANGGLSSARNYGLQMAKGKYVIFLDADDMLEKNNLKHLSEFLDNQNGNNAVFGKFVKFYDDGTSEYPWYQEYNYREGLQTDFHSRLVEKNSLPPCAPLSPLSIIKEHNLTFDESLTSYEDWDFWLNLSSYCNFYYIPGENAAARVRFHSGSMSTDNWRMEINQLKVRLELAKSITNKMDNLSNTKGIESSVKTLLYTIADNIAEGSADQARERLEILIGIYPHKKIKILNKKYLLSHPTLFRKCAWLLWERIRNIVCNK